ncbi:MAG: hypothetical protein C0617_16425 [Desulfuromonas sp.]|nr:MAG: hypothetical protein C0617_16425 [Desulfuromonas sp.]
MLLLTSSLPVRLERLRIGGFFGVLGAGGRVLGAISGGILLGLRSLFPFGPVPVLGLFSGRPG